MSKIALQYDVPLGILPLLSGFFWHCDQIFIPPFTKGVKGNSIQRPAAREGQKKSRRSFNVERQCCMQKEVSVFPAPTSMRPGALRGAS